MNVLKVLFRTTLILGISLSSFFLVAKAATAVVPTNSGSFQVAGKAISYSELNLGSNELLGDVAISIRQLDANDKPIQTLCETKSSNDDKTKGMFVCDLTISRGTKLLMTASHNTTENYSITMVAEDQAIPFYPRLKLKNVPSNLCWNKADKIASLANTTNQPTMLSQFWICGNAAKEMWNDTKSYQTAWAAIANEIAALRNDYPKQVSTPPEIIIDTEGPDEAKSNAAYSYTGTNLKGCWPTPTTTKFADEPYIVIHSGTIRDVNSDNPYLRLLTDHEFGHLKDWQEGNCSKFGSIVPKSIMSGILQRWKNEGVTSDNAAYKAINETSYKLSKVNGNGHPSDDNMEAYASAFAVQRNATAELQKNIDLLKSSAINSDKQHGIDIENIIKFVTSGKKQ